MVKENILMALKVLSYDCFLLFNFYIIYFIFFYTPFIFLSAVRPSSRPSISSRV